MKRLLINEEEKKRILRLYEKVGDPLTQQALSSPLAREIKTYQKFFNDYYKGKPNPPVVLPIDGNWNSKEYNDVLERFLKDNGVQVLRCTKEENDYCQKDTQGRDMEGIVYTTQVKMGQYMKELMDKFYNSQNTSGGTKSEFVNTTNDSYYDYMFKDGKYYFKGKGASAKTYPNWVEATGKGLEAIKKNVKFQ